MTTPLGNAVHAVRGGNRWRLGDGRRSGPWPAEHMSRPQRDLELEAAVGIAQLVAEQILHLAQPVPGRLRVHVRMLRHLVGVAAVLEPGQQRLGQPILLGGAKALQRGEPGRPQGASQLLVGEDEQGGQVLVAAHQVLPAVAGLGPGAGGRGPGGPVARARARASWPSSTRAAIRCRASATWSSRAGTTRW